MQPRTRRPVPHPGQGHRNQSLLATLTNNAVAANRRREVRVPTLREFGSGSLFRTGAMECHRNRDRDASWMTPSRGPRLGPGHFVGTARPYRDRRHTASRPPGTTGERTVGPRVRGHGDQIDVLRVGRHGECAQHRLRRRSTGVSSPLASPPNDASQTPLAPPPAEPLSHPLTSGHGGCAHNTPQNYAVPPYVPLTCAFLRCPDTYPSPPHTRKWRT